MKKAYLNVLFNLSLVLILFWTNVKVAAKTSFRKHSETNRDVVDVGLARRRAQIVTTIGSINRVEIINAKSDTIIRTLMNNTQIVLSEHGLSLVSQLNFMAVPSKNGTIRAMRFRIERNSPMSNITTHVDYNPPFSACGNTGFNFAMCSNRLGLGNNVLTITPYSRPGGNGIPGSSLILSFTILRNTPACSIPTFVGQWENFDPVYPITVSESQGGMLGTDLVLFSGFSGDYNFVTDKTFAYDTASGTENKTWREMDPIPEPIGITHAGHVFKNQKIYACGGYIGGNDYPAGSDCYLYNHKSPRGRQWSPLPSLPDKRSGGGMVFDSKRNSLIYATGAYRHSWVGDPEIVDRSDVWELFLGNTSQGWINKTSIPYIANHVGFTTIRLLNGTERHFFLGGQQGQLESGGNFDKHYEYVASNDTWTERKKMPFGRGHFSSSVVNYRHCGYFIAAGATNLGNYEKTADISYYSLEHDNWTRIGDLPFALNSPVCAISGEYFYCQSGWVSSPYSTKRKIM